MAIALESDFRSLKTGPLPDVAERASPPSGRGEAFASQLRQKHGAGEPRADTETPEAVALAYGGLILPLHPADSPDAAAPEMAAPVLLDTEVVDIPGKLTGEKTAVPETEAQVRTPNVGTDTQEAAPSANPPPAPAPTGAPRDGRDLAATADRAETAPKLRATDTDIARPQPAGAPSAQPAPALNAQSGNVSAETVAVIAAVSPAKPKPAAMPERPAATGIAEPQAAKAAPQTSQSEKPAEAELVANEGAAPDIIGESPAAVSDKPAQTGTASVSPTATGLAAAPALSPAPAPTASPVPMTPVQAVITAAPAQIVNIVAQSAADGQSDRIVVQLDPPELGRVSIDFKFDAAGLQHVTITGETPEAMRQLRQMHFELVQSLERQGLSGQNMTFQHQQQNAQQSPTPGALARPGAASDETPLLAASALRAGELPTTPRTPSGGRLDIRL